ncbi:MAG: hypothetical protein SNJ84_01025 [Verrucomicrobiia bacterium]
MKPAVPTYLIVFGALFVVVGGLGGGFWYWAASELDTARSVREQVTTKLTAMDRRPILPVQKNLDALTEKKNEFAAILDNALPGLKARNAAFAEVVTAWQDGRPSAGLSPDGWKRLMNERRQALDKEAADRKVKIPENFYYGFSRYRLPNPEAQFTPQLGVQLVAIDRLANILIESRVESIRAIRRVYFEEPARAGGPPAGEEALPGAILQDPLKLYWVYPFELSFRCTTPQLAQVVNAIASAPELFIIRFIQVENEVTEVKRRSAIQTQLATEVRQTGKLFVTVAGDELLNIRLRVDLILWAEGEPSAGGETGGGGGRNARP